LVTGATGKTARHLIPKLIQRGVTVRAVSRAPAQARPGSESQHFDWFDESTYASALTGADAIYVVSPQSADGTADPTAQLQKFLHGAADGGVSRIALLSSIGVGQAPPDDPLRRMELAVIESGVPYTILRPAAFMQNFSENHWSGVARTVRETGRLAMPFGDHAVSYVSAGDIAEVAAAALTENGHAGMGYTLTGPEAITLIEVAAHISAAAGRSVQYSEADQDALRRALLDSGAPAEIASYVSQAFQFAMTSGVMRAVTGDILAVTGRPATTFAEFALGAAGAWIA
jgi:uncharacterized protein YbjT (DUF2867 family)